MNTINPMSYIDSILAEWASPKVRRTIHLIILLVAVLVAIWMGVDEDWKQFIAAIIAGIYSASNAANTPPVASDTDGVENEGREDDDDASSLDSSEISAGADSADDDAPIADPFSGESS